MANNNDASELFKKTEIYQQLLAANLQATKSASLELFGYDVYYLKLIVNKGQTRKAPKSEHYKKKVEMFVEDKLIIGGKI